MNCFNEYLYKYGLHDCKLNKMEIKNGILCLYFNQGVYELNEDGKETSLTGSCILSMQLAEISNSLNLSEQIDVVKISKGKKFDVEYETFEKILNKFEFDVAINYYSYFCNTIMLKGYIRSAEYEITIPMVRRVSFEFPKTRVGEVS